MSEQIVKSELTIQGILDRAHPVGSYYISETATSPASLFGGTWEQVKNGTLFSAGYTYQEWTYICDENASFTLTSTSKVRYGVYDTYIEKTLAAGTYTANEALFGSDPVKDVAKHVDIYKTKTIGNPGDTGGEVNHKLSTAEMPFHQHPIMTNEAASWNTAAWSSETWLFFPNSGTYSNKQSTGKGLGPTWTGYSGGNMNGTQPHNNMMPYQIVYIWRRTA